MVDHGVVPPFDRVEPIQTRLYRLARRDVARPDQSGEFGRGQLPQLNHQPIVVGCLAENDSAPRAQARGALSGECYLMSNRSLFMTLTHAATKSSTNLPWLSSCA